MRLLLLLPLLSSLPRRASADPPPVAALSVDAALAARVPLALSAETARALLDARLAGARASPLAAHLPALRQLAALGGAVAALGARDAGALWALLAGAADAAAADAAGAGAGGGGAAPARRLFLADAAAAGDALPPALAAPLARARAHRRARDGGVRARLGRGARGRRRGRRGGRRGAAARARRGRGPQGGAL